MTATGLGAISLIAIASMFVGMAVLTVAGVGLYERAAAMVALLVVYVVVMELLGADGSHE
jgi:hypothetical protein